MPLVSWVLAGATSIPNGMPCFSTATWILTPRIFLPPSMPRVKPLGAERQERLVWGFWCQACNRIPSSEFLFDCWDGLVAGRALEADDNLPHAVLRSESLL